MPLLTTLPVCQSGTHTSQPSNSAMVSSCVSDWHTEFQIPKLHNFSRHVKNAVDSGVATQRARKQICQVLRTYMTAHAVYPTSEQYTTVRKRLTEKYPTLKDSEGTTKWVSILKLFMALVSVRCFFCLEFMENGIKILF